MDAKMFQRALVALDGSAEAEAILPFFLQVAGPLDVEVVLFRVVPDRPGSTMTEQADQQLDAEEYLAPLAVEMRDKGVRVSTQVQRGEPVAEILAVARAAGADLIAMTTHGRTGLRRAVMGSVADAVVRQSDIPVLLLRASERQIAARAARAA
jgi:nucleotide-binding universal stress UspA family protein